MQLEGQHVFPASAGRVWDLLMDPAALSGCLPGRERFERADSPADGTSAATNASEAYDVTLRVGVANIRGTYQGKVRVGDKVPGERYNLSVDGSSAIGFVHGQATIELREEGTASLTPASGTPSPTPLERGPGGEARTPNPQPPTPDAGVRTVVTYRGDAQVGGTIAAVGQRLLAGAARMLIGQFFRCMEQRLK